MTIETQKRKAYLLTGRTRIEEKSMNWKGLTKEEIQLRLPLLVIKGAKGFLGCGYINIETCNKTGEACGIVIGVKTHDEMLSAEVKAVSQEAARLGVRVEMKGEGIRAFSVTQGEIGVYP